MERRSILISAVLGFTAVGLGAFGAHGLKQVVTDLPDAAQRLAWWETGARYHLAHAIAAGLFAVMAVKSDSRVALWGPLLFILGIVLFSGSLYVMAMTGNTRLGMVTPFGGIAFMAGWVMLGWLALSRR